MQGFYGEGAAADTASAAVAGTGKRRGKKSVHVCQRCGAAVQDLKKHMQLHTGHFKFYCDICKKGFADRTNYEEHMRKHEGLKFHCEYCSKPFTSRKGLNYHLSEHTGKYRFVCEICGQGFNPKPMYEKHLRSHVQGAPVKEEPYS